MKDLLTKESTPIWFDVRKPIEFDESTARTRILQNPPVTSNTLSSLNTSGEIRFEYIPSNDQVIHLADKNTCLRLRCTFYTANSVNNQWQGNTGVLPTTNVSFNRNADVTLEAAFFGYLFQRIELYIGQSTAVDLISYFPIWYQLMCHMQPLDFKLAYGEQMGYLPDENSGQAIGNINPYLLIASLNALNVGANGAFGVVATITGRVGGYAANALIPYTIFGTNIVLNLVAPAAINAGVTVTWVFAVAAPFAFVAGTAANPINTPYFYTGGILILQNATTNAIAAGGAVNILCGNTTETALVASAIGAAPVNGSTIQLPLNITYSSQLYEPGYYNRQNLYNSIPQTTDTSGRTFEIMIPLFYLFGFCNWFNRLTSNLSFQIRLQRDISTNPFIGAPNTDGYFLINEMYLQIMQVVPEDRIKVEFNQQIQHPIEIGYATPLIQQFPISGLDINYIVPAGSYKPDFVFVIFKDATQATSSQINGSLNSNADIQNLQVNLGGELYPNNQQDAHWGIGTDTKMVGINQFYLQFKECCTKMCGECSMSFKQFRDLYPIFAFDLTAQAIKVRNQATQVNIIGRRNSNTPTPATGNVVSVNMTVVVIYEKFFDAKYLANELLPKSVPSSSSEGATIGSGLYSN